MRLERAIILALQKGPSWNSGGTIEIPADAMIELVVVNKEVSVRLSYCF